MEHMTLDELLLEQNEQQINDYYQILEDLKINRIATKVIENLSGESILKIMQEIDKKEIDSKSDLFFSGDLVILYPNIKEMHSKKYLTCDFSGAIIRPKSLYVNYRPLIENISSKEVYVLKRTIKVEPGYVWNLPNTIIELEELERKMNLSIVDNETGIDYSHFYRQMGGNIVLQKLNRRRKV